MHASWKNIITGMVLAYFAACAPVKFEKALQPCEGNCVRAEGGIRKFTVERMVGEGLVDVLIVNDNSGSMSPEQEKMGTRFPTFLQSLNGLDYRVAMTTTDISSSFSGTPAGISNYPNTYNGNGAWQDGKLIEFAPGLKYLDRNTPNKEHLFNTTVKRNETRHCENSEYTQCPSSDERGIFAANLTLDRASEFMRPLAHLAVIVLSDEDERGLSDARSAVDDNDRSLMRMYPLEDFDKPETFVARFRQMFPEKTMSFHSIIVKPGDLSCLQQQYEYRPPDPSRNNRPIVLRGVEGYSYARLSEMTGGRIGSICAGDYGAQLTDIGHYIQGQVTSLPFSCRPKNDNYSVSFDPQPAYDVNVEADFDKLQLNVLNPLPPMTKVLLTYECE